MTLDRDLLDAVKDLDEHGLRRLQILTKAQLDRSGATDPTEANVSLRQQMVRCGKANCTQCPHGPYWYAYWWEDGKRRSKYVGKLDDIPEARMSQAEKSRSGARRNSRPPLRSHVDG